MNGSDEKRDPPAFFREEKQGGVRKLDVERGWKGWEAKSNAGGSLSGC